MAENITRNEQIMLNSGIVFPEGMMERIAMLTTKKAVLDELMNYFAGNMVQVQQFVNLNILTVAQKLYFLNYFFSDTKQNKKNRKDYPNLLGEYQTLKSENKKYKKKLGGIDIKAIEADIEETNNGKKLSDIISDAHKIVAQTTDDGRQLKTNSETAKQEQLDISAATSKPQKTVSLSKTPQEIAELLRAELIGISGVDANIKKFNILNGYFSEDIGRFSIITDLVRLNILNEKEAVLLLYPHFNIKQKSNRKTYPGLANTYKTLKSNLDSTFINSKGGIEYEILKEHIMQDVSASSNDVESEAVLLERQRKAEEFEREIQKITERYDGLFSVARRLDESYRDTIKSENFNIMITAIVSEIPNIEDQTIKNLYKSTLDKLNNVLASINPENQNDKYKFILIKTFITKYFNENPEDLHILNNLIDENLDGISERLNAVLIKMDSQSYNLNSLFEKIVDNLKYKKDTAVHTDVIDQIGATVRIFETVADSLELDRYSEGNIRTVFSKSFISAFEKVLNSANSFNSYLENERLEKLRKGLNPVIFKEIIEILKKYNGNSNDFDFQKSKDFLHNMVLFRTIEKFSSSDVIKLLNLPFSFSGNSQEETKQIHDTFSIFLAKDDLHMINNFIKLKLFADESFRAMLQTVARYNLSDTTENAVKTISEMVNSSNDQTLIRYAVISERILKSNNLSKGLKNYLLGLAREKSKKEKALIEMIDETTDFISGTLTERNKHSKANQAYLFYKFLMENRDIFAPEIADKPLSYISPNKEYVNGHGNPLFEDLILKDNNFYSKIEKIKDFCRENGQSTFLFEEYLERKSNFLNPNSEILTSSGELSELLIESLQNGYGRMDSSIKGEVAELDDNQLDIFTKEIKDIDSSERMLDDKKLYARWLSNFNQYLNSLPEGLDDVEYHTIQNPYFQAIMNSKNMGTANQSKDLEGILNNKNFPIIFEQLPKIYQTNIVDLIFSQKMKITSDAKTNLSLKFIANDDVDFENKHEALALEFIISNFNSNNESLNQNIAKELLKTGESFYDIVGEISKNPKQFSNFSASIFKNDEIKNYILAPKFLYIIRTLQKSQLNVFSNDFAKSELYNTLDAHEKQAVIDSVLKNPNIENNSFELINRLFIADSNRTRDEIRDGVAMVMDQNMISLLTKNKNFEGYLMNIDAALVNSSSFDILLTVMDGLQFNKEGYFNIVFSRLKEIRKTANETLTAKINNIFKARVNMLPVNIQDNFMSAQTKLNHVYDYITAELEKPETNAVSVIAREINKFNPETDSDTLEIFFKKMAKHRQAMAFFNNIFMKKPYTHLYSKGFVAFIDNISDPKIKSSIISEVVKSKLLNKKDAAFIINFWEKVISNEEILTSSILSNILSNINSIQQSEKNDRSENIRYFAIKNLLSNYETSPEPIAIDEAAKNIKIDIASEKSLEFLDLISSSPKAFNYFINNIGEDTLLKIIKNSSAAQTLARNNTIDSNKSLITMLTKKRLFKKPIISKINEGERNSFFMAFASSAKLSRDTQDLIIKQYPKNSTVKGEIINLLSRNANASQQRNTRSSGPTTNTEDYVESASRSPIAPTSNISGEVRNIRNLSESQLFELARSSNSIEDSQFLLNSYGKIKQNMKNDFIYVLGRYSYVNLSISKAAYDLMADSHSKFAFVVNLTQNPNTKNDKEILDFIMSKSEELSKVEDKKLLEDLLVGLVGQETIVKDKRLWREFIRPGRTSTQALHEHP